ncbi:MAG: hypothetical protein LBL66_07290 [Clostridiales bacterium]|nr:hypothetical protein [Clostridiales bacterium]
MQTAPTEGARAFLCLVEIAASRFALLAMTRGAFALLATTGINALCPLP